MLSLLVTMAAPGSTFAEYARLDGTPIHPWREALLDSMNAHRERRGLARLRLNRKLNAAAEARLADMFDRGYFGLALFAHE